MNRLEGLICIVAGAGATGSGVGTGQATALRFAREGGEVLIVDRDEQAAMSTQRQAEEAGAQAHIFVCDLSDEGEVERMVAHAVDRWGRVDVLHNNVGTQQFGTVVTTTTDEWLTSFRLNLQSAVLASKYAIPHMASGRGGAIVNTSSIAALRPRGGNVAYSTLKGALISMTRAMAIDHGPEGIRVNCIVPGPIYTPMAVREGVDEERRAQRVDVTAIKREGNAWDIADAAVFLASPESRFVTGVTLPVDGGVTLRTPTR